jgi:hypothetical protein
VVKVDYDHNKIHVYKQGADIYPKGGFILKPQLNTIPVINAEVADGNRRKENFILIQGQDCACYFLKNI